MSPSDVFVKNSHPTSGATQHRLLADNGSELIATGSIFSETSFFDEELDTLTKLRLFITDKKNFVYSIFSAAGDQKSKWHYRIKSLKSTCSMTGGLQTVLAPTDIFFSTVYGLCGTESDAVKSLRPCLKDNFTIASAG